MKNIIYFFIAFFLIFSAYSQEFDKEKMDNYLDILGKNYQSMGNIIIRKEEQTIYVARFGTAGVIPFPKEVAEKYRIGSISKMVTAILIMQMVEKGELELNETLQNYFPQVPNSEKITISNLLEHTSGLGDIIVKQDSLSFWLFEPVKEQDIVEEIVRQGIFFQPGTNVRYSNSGYYLLARILEKKSGKSYPDLVKEKIVSPLSLNHTVAGAPDGTGIASSYKLNYKQKEWEVIPDFYFPNITGVGDLASVPADMVRIIEALFNGQFISLATLQQMKPVNKQTRFGKGIASIPFMEKVLYGHSGGTNGSHALLLYNEEDKVSFAITVNGQETLTNDIVIGALSILYNRDFDLPEFPELNFTDFDPDTFSLFEGIYSSKDFPLKIHVFRQGDDLFLQATGQPSFPVDQVEKTKFTKKDIRLEVEFFPEKDQMVFVQMGGKYELTKE